MGSVFFSEGTSTVLNRSNTTGSLSEGTKPHLGDVEDTEDNNGERGTHMFRRESNLTEAEKEARRKWAEFKKARAIARKEAREKRAELKKAEAIARKEAREKRGTYMFIRESNLTEAEKEAIRKRAELTKAEAIARKEAI